MLWFHGLLLLVMMEAIFLFSLQHYPRCTNTYTSNHKYTHHSCCALSWLATFWAYVPHAAISSLCSVWKLLISTLSPISAPGSVMAREHCGHITLLDDRTTCFHPVMSQRLWPVIRYKAHQNRLFFSSDCFLFETKFHYRHKPKIKICLDVFCKSVQWDLWLTVYTGTSPVEPRET